MDINEFINFSGLFMKLYEEHRDELITHRIEATHFSEILQFVDEGGYSAFDIMQDECELTDKRICFVFGLDDNDANESNTQNSWSSYYIEYDRILKEFIRCDYEQG